MKILITQDEISRKTDELAAQINSGCAGKTPVLLVILKGALIFAADLMRRLTIDVTVDFMQVSSYGSDTKSSGEIKILKDAQTDLKGRDVIIIEDIIDSGNTLKSLTELLKKRGASVRICTLLSKPARREVSLDIDYIGFEIPDKFVVGYGMDYDEHYRNLPYIALLEE